MSDGVKFRFTSIEQFHKTLGDVISTVLKGLAGGPVVLTLGRDTRTIEQNAKGWPMFRDLSQQVDWHGQKLQDWEWKIILTASVRKQRAVQGLDGGFVVLGYPTSKLSKAQYSDLIELAYAFGAEHGVQWSEPALKHYEELVQRDTQQKDPASS